MPHKNIDLLGEQPLFKGLGSCSVHSQDRDEQDARGDENLATSKNDEKVSLLPVAEEPNFGAEEDL